MSQAHVLVGIFVGGRATRMGGIPKGLLPAPDGSGSLIARLVNVATSALGASTPVVLVGAGSSYVSLGLRALADSPPGVGPLGGLVALLEETKRSGAGAALALACDLPFVTGELLRTLVDAAPNAAAVAPKPAGIWQPLCARYAPEASLRAARAGLALGEHALKRVLERLGPEAVELPLPEDAARLLADWDSPDDVRR